MAQELMKGHVWGDRKDAVDRKGNPIVTYPVMVEHKHDEIRVHVVVDGESVVYNSFAGKPLANLESFSPSFLMVSLMTGIKEFDMGFEANGNFNDSYRWVRSTNGLPADLKGVPTLWYIFGLPGLGGTLYEQLGHRLSVRDAFNAHTHIVTKVPQVHWANDEGEVNALFWEAREHGLEGVMVKQPNHAYQRKRTDGWLKLKPENDASGVIVGMTEAICGKDQPELGLKVGDPLGRIGSVALEIGGPEPSIASPHGIPHELGRDMFLHPESYYGQTVDFKYMERDRQGGYRHPTFHRLREAVQ